MSATLMRLQPWHQEMVDSGVMTLGQAGEIQLLQEGTPEGVWFVLPPHLQLPARRAQLFETPAANRLPL
jgi:hypothetical protein